MLAPFAFGVWFVSVAALAAAFIWSDHRFLEEYRKRHADFLSAGERMDLFARDPIALLRRTRQDFLSMAYARDAPSADQDLERLRRQSSRLFLAVVFAGFGGLPAAFLVVGLAGRAVKVLDLGVLGYAAIAVFWAAWLLWVVRHPGHSRLALAMLVAGFLLSLLGAGVALILSLD